MAADQDLLEVIEEDTDSSVDRDASHFACMTCYPDEPQPGDNVVALCGKYGSISVLFEGISVDKACLLCVQVTLVGVCMRGHNLREER